MSFLSNLGLKSKNPETRRATVEDLAREDDPATLKHLYPMLEDEDKEVRRTTVKAIATFKEVTSIPALVKCFDDEDRDVRMFAIDALKKIGGMDAREAIRGALHNRDFALRKKAATTLETLNWHPETPEERVLVAVALGRFEEAAVEKDLAIELLAEGLTTDNASIRASIVEALSRIDDPRTLRYLSSVLKDPEGSVRIAAVDALRKIRDVRVFDPLVEALEDPDHRVRLMAVEAVSAIGGTRAAGPLIELLKDAAMEVRAAAATAVGKLEDPRAVTPLISLLQDREQDVRLAAAKSLGELHDSKAVTGLVALLADPAPTVRSAAMHALHSIDPNWQHLEAALGAVPDLETQLYSKEYWVRQAAAKTLSELESGPKINTELPTLKLAGAQPVSEMDDAGFAAIEPLVAELESGDAATRYRAAMDLGKSEHPRAVTPLVRAMFDEEDTVRRAAADALERLAWRTGNDSERALQAIILRRWDDAVAIGSGAVDPLIRALQNFDPLSQKNAAEALGKICDGRAVDALLKALDGQDFGVRKAAAEALGNLGDPRAIEGLQAAQGDPFKPVRDAATQALAKLGIV